MRLHFILSPNTMPVPFDYQHRLTGVFHKWLADNDLHDKISLYSLSWLDGSRRVVNRLECPNGARWFVSLFEDKYAERLVNGALQEPEMFCGMRVLEIRQQTTPDFGTKYKFKVGSAVFAKGKCAKGETAPHHLYHEPIADEILTKTLVHKMDVANYESADPHFNDEDKKVRISFDREFANPRVKLIQIKDTLIHASICPVIVEGTPEAVRFAWNVGVGSGTGSCFGSLY